MFSKLIMSIIVISFVGGCATTNVDARKRITFKQDGNDVIVTVDNKILFDVADANLREDAKPVLDLLVKESLSRSKKDFQIEGHTDIRGAEQSNIKLSKARAESVKRAIVERGVLSSRIDTVGYASKFPVIANASSESDHEQNRRAVIRIKNERVENVRTSSFELGFDSMISSLGLK